MKEVVLNKGQGTVTMSFEAYMRVHRDSVLLAVLLDNSVAADDVLLKNYRAISGLGTGFTLCQCPMTDNEAKKFVYGGAVNDAE